MGSVKLLTFILLTSFIFFFFGASPTYAGSFFDDFNDGNTDGWRFENYWSGIGEWNVVDGALEQNSCGDGYGAFFDGLQLSDQTVQTDLYARYYGGYGGIGIWVKDYRNWIFVRIYPATGQLWIHEAYEGFDKGGILTFYPLNAASNTWHEMKVEANSTTGVIDVYVNGEFITTYTATTPNRSGWTGYFSGNCGGFYDNFSLTWPDPVPSPAEKELAVKLAPTTLPTAKIGQPYRAELVAKAISPDLGKLTMTITGLPRGLKVYKCSNTSKAVSCNLGGSVLGTTQLGIHQVTVKVSNDSGASRFFTTPIEVVKGK